MKFTSNNSKVVVAVRHADDIKVYWRYKSGPITPWRELSLTERALLVSTPLKWRLKYEIYGDDGHVGEHELDVLTPCVFKEVNQVMHEYLCKLVEGWQVVNNTMITLIPI